MAIFLRNMIFPSCTKTVSLLLRSQHTISNTRLIQVLCMPGRNQPIRSTVSLATSRSLLGQYNFLSMTNECLAGQVARRTTFRKICCCATFIPNDLRAHSPYWGSTKLFHSIANKNKEDKLSNENNEPKKLTTLMKKLKLMIKRYWYIYIPVHGITSIIWFGGFYYALRSGFDVTPYLEKLGTQWLLDSLENSNMGYYALAAALYKIISPIRYAVTIGGIAVSVKTLKRFGYINENDITKEELHYIYQDKKGELMDKTDKIRQKYKTKKIQIILRYNRKREELRRKNVKRITYLRDMYSRGRKDSKKKNGTNVRKNGNGSKTGNGCSNKSYSKKNNDYS